MGTSLIVGDSRAYDVILKISLFSFGLNISQGLDDGILYYFFPGV
jgi:hypothetical protein